MTTKKQYSKRYTSWVETKFNGDFEAARVYMRNLGSKGGKATHKKYGKSHMSKIGKKGWQGLVNNRFGGNEDDTKSYMAHIGRATYFKSLNWKKDVINKEEIMAQRILKKHQPIKTTTPHQFEVEYEVTPKNNNRHRTIIAGGELTINNSKGKPNHILQMTVNYINEKHQLSIFSDFKQPAEYEHYPGEDVERYEEIPEHWREEYDLYDCIESYWYPVEDQNESIMVIIYYRQKELAQDVLMKWLNQPKLF